MREAYSARNTNAPHTTLSSRVQHQHIGRVYRNASSITSVLVGHRKECHGKRSFSNCNNESCKQHTKRRRRPKMCCRSQNKSLVWSCTWKLLLSGAAGTAWSPKIHFRYRCTPNNYSPRRRRPPAPGRHSCQAYGSTWKLFLDVRPHRRHLCYIVSGA